MILAISPDGLCQRGIAADAFGLRDGASAAAAQSELHNRANLQFAVRICSGDCTRV
jgi:hypothetical protein